MKAKHTTAAKQPEAVETEQTYEEIFARLFAVEKHAKEQDATIDMLRAEVVRLERHQMIGVNPELITRGK